jgi:hypothetical protein
MRAAILLALHVETGNGAEDVQPRVGIAAYLDLRFDRPEGVESLVEQVPHNARLRLITGGANIADRQVIVHSHVAFDEAGDLPIVSRAIVALENEDVTTTGGPPITLAVPLLIRVGEGRADRITQRRRIAGLGGTDAVRQTGFFHCGS